MPVWTSWVPAEGLVGRITHFFAKASVAVVELSAPLNKGDKITIRGSTTTIEQTVDSMETEHKQIPTAQAGQSIGMKVAGRVRENDIVYRVKVTV
jgi:translation elongation factor EF-Tu-like GTPase